MSRTLARCHHNRARVVLGCRLKQPFVAKLAFFEVCQVGERRAAPRRSAEGRTLNPWPGITEHGSGKPLHVQGDADHPGIRVVDKYVKNSRKNGGPGRRRGTRGCWPQKRHMKVLYVCTLFLTAYTYCLLWLLIWEVHKSNWEPASKYKALIQKIVYTPFPTPNNTQYKRFF
jgi:hypothetical protein